MMIRVQTRRTVHSRSRGPTNNYLNRKIPNQNDDSGPDKENGTFTTPSGFCKCTTHGHVGQRITT